MSSSDGLLIGYEEIAEFCRRPVKTIMSWKEDMESKDVLHYQTFGAPPNRRQMVCCFISDLKTYLKAREARKRIDKEEGHE